MIKLKKCLICLFVVLVAFNFVLVPKSEALINNLFGWNYELNGDVFSLTRAQKIEAYEGALKQYIKDNNQEGIARVSRKLGVAYEAEGDESPIKDEKIKYYETSMGYYDYGGFSDDKERIKEKIKILKIKK